MFSAPLCEKDILLTQRFTSVLGTANCFFVPTGQAGQAFALLQCVSEVWFLAGTSATVFSCQVSPRCGHPNIPQVVGSFVCGRDD